jgi:hypothetical protein
MLKHKHHIIPKYKGGSNLPENLVEVSVTQHAMFHYCNWKLWGNDQDKIAWMALSGMISCEEAVHQSLKLGAKIRNQLPCKEETKQKISTNNKKMWESLTDEQKQNRLTGFWKGTPPEMREEISKKIQKAKGSIVICKDYNTNQEKEFPSLQSARKYYKIGMSTIRELVANPQKIHKGISAYYKNNA